MKSISSAISRHTRRRSSTDILKQNLLPSVSVIDGIRNISTGNFTGLNFNIRRNTNADNCNLRHLSSSAGAASFNASGASGSGKTDVEGSESEAKADEAKDANSNNEEAAAESKKSDNTSELDNKISDLETQLEEQKEKTKELTSNLRLAYADFENARKRHTTEIDNAKAYGINKFAKSMTEVADNLHRALEGNVNPSNMAEKSDEEVKEAFKQLHEGLKLTDDILMKNFSQYNIEKISPELPAEGSSEGGEMFDPKLHEAMFTLDSETPKDTIVHLMQPGWKIKDRVLRAARVGTSKGPKKD